MSEIDRYPLLVAACKEVTVTADGVIPHHYDPFRETGSFVTVAGDVLTFGHEGARVVILAEGSVVLTPAEQDLFARHLFRAMDATNVVAAEEVR